METLQNFLLNTQWHMTSCTEKTRFCCLFCAAFLLFPTSVSLSDTFVSGNFGIVANISFQIADPLQGRDIATPSFNFASQPSSC